MRLTRALLLAASTAFVAAALGPPLTAQQLSGNGIAPDTPPAMTATRAAPEAPRLDGRLDDPIWQSAAIATGFRQREPHDGEEPTEPTEVRIVYTEEALYVSARLFDSQPDRVVGRLGRRDSYTSSDEFWVAIDSYHDHRTAFCFGVNPAGVRSDEITTNDDPHGDESWDPVWEVAARTDTLGWVAEMRIPFSQLRFSSAEEQLWGINFYRRVFRNNEETVWSWVANTEQGFASQFGHVQGIVGIEAPRRVELLPYVVTQSEFVEGVDPDNPFHDGSTQGVTGGLDLKYGVTSNLTLDATINPDFGQVEADPAVVNLSAFETFFDERRPFFVEGANLFQFGAGSGGFVFGAPQLFYSRRIGAAPSRPAFEPDGYVDNPTATSIIGAGKLSGRTAGWSIGLLDAITAREFARVQVPGSEPESRPVEPLTNFTVASLRRDFRGGSTGIGALGTMVHRDVSDSVFATMGSAAYSGGVDFFHRFGGNQFAVSGTISGSLVRGDSVAILSTQRSSARYFQRPDQDYVAVDPSRTSLAGYATSVQLGKVSGNWVYGTDFYAYSPGFEINDAGFQSQTDRIFHGMRVTRRWLEPGRVFRRFSVTSTFAQQWNFGGTRSFRSLYTGVSGQLRNYWQFSLGGNLNATGMSDKATRGGPLLESPASRSARVWMGTDLRKAVAIAAASNYARSDVGGWEIAVASEVQLRPSSAVRIGFLPGWTRGRSMAFYVTQRRDGTATATYGGRYLFAQLEQTEVDLTVRLDVALSPSLSIQLWAQPFIASGDYTDFKELARPASFDFLRYGIDGASTITFDEETNRYTVDPDGAGEAPVITFDNPDFMVRSLRSNLVVRWEYVRGSTLFVVWNHGRSGGSSDPSFRLGDQLGNLWDDDAQNTLLVKVNYWLSR
ncbi:MAG: hypothetical protein AMS20_10470 [Gemmatimonas sp. SG8_28]|nr:MAG: hypothetical protein AMS20_10470 [Gemmatimonas sp. SG8_28]